jgi:hypothetical protein
MTTRSGRQYSNPSAVAIIVPASTAPPPDPHKWSHPETFSYFDLSNIQGGLHDLPKNANSWLPLFSGKEVSGNSHWTHFCDSLEFHQTSQEHPDVFMRLFASSLVGDAKTWIDALPKGAIKTPEELERAFKIRWCNHEHTQDLFSQYIDICKGSCEGVRDFSDRFNLLLKRVRPKLNSEEAILEHYLNSLEGVLQFTLRDRSPSTLEEAQDLAYQIERNLEFEEYICQVNLSCNNDLWNTCEALVAEPEPLEVFEVEPTPPKRKWSFSHTNVQDISFQENPTEPEPCQDKEEETKIPLSQTFERFPPEEAPLFIHQVDNFSPKQGDITPFYVTLQVNNAFLHNCVLHPNASTNIITEETMQQLGLTLSQSNTGGGFARGVIKELEVAFDSCPSAPFFLDVMVVDAVSSWGIILHKDLIKHLAGSFQEKESKAIIPHPEGGFFTIHKEPFMGSPVETFDEASDQLLCIDSDVSNWFVQEGSLDFDTVEESEGIWTLEFDGSHSSSGSGTGIVLTAPSGETFYHSYRLEYHCTNNIAEYEALILGFNLAIDKGVAHLRAKGDSDLIVSQVMMKFSTKNEKLKKY